MMPLTTRAHGRAALPAQTKTQLRRHGNDIASAELAEDFRTKTSSSTEGRSMVSADAEVVANCAL
jgi:hypothetical protein